MLLVRTVIFSFLCVLLCSCYTNRGHSLISVSLCTCFASQVVECLDAHDGTIRDIQWNSLVPHWLASAGNCRANCLLSVYYPCVWTSGPSSAFLSSSHHGLSLSPSYILSPSGPNVQSQTLRLSIHCLTSLPIPNSPFRRRRLRQGVGCAVP